MRVVYALTKYAIVDGLKPIVPPVGSLETLEKSASEIKDRKTKEEALVAIDIFKTSQSQQQKASA